MFLRFDLHDLNVKLRQKLTKITKLEKTTADENAAELYNFFCHYLHTLQNRDRLVRNSESKFPFFDKKLDCRLEQDALLVMKLIVSMDSMRDGSSIQKLLVAVNNCIAVAPVDPASHLLDLLRQFFAFFVEYLRHLDVRVCEIFFPESFKPKVEPVALRQFGIINDEDELVGEQKSNAKRHLIKQVILEKAPELLFEELNEDHSEYSDDEEDIPVLNVTRRILVSAKEEREIIANKLLDIMEQDAKKLIEARPNGSEPLSMNGVISEHPRFFNICVVMDNTWKVHTPPAIIRFLNVFCSIVLQRPLNTSIVRVVRDFFVDTPDFLQVAPPQVFRQLGITAMQFLPEANSESISQLETYYLEILVATVRSLNSDELNQAVRLLTNCANTNDKSDNTIAYKGLAHVAICQAPDAKQVPEYQVRRDEILETFCKALTQRTLNFYLTGPLTILFPHLTETEECRLMHHVRNSPLKADSESETPHGMLEIFRSMALERIQNAYEKGKENIVRDTLPFSRDVSSIVLSY